jgi:hypothetical protein
MIGCVQCNSIKIRCRKCVEGSRFRAKVSGDATKIRPDEMEPDEAVSSNMSSTNYTVGRRLST